MLPTAGLSDQVTAVLVVLATVAVKAWVCEGVRVTLAGVRVTLTGAAVPDGVRKATICMIHRPDELRGAVALWLPAVVTIWSSVMSPSGVVSSRLVKPLPEPFVRLATMLAPKTRSVGLVVVAAALLLLALLPLPAAVTSTGMFRSAPLYS